jgi:multisubunit Na+/H+ antiporter MnhB subunit
MFTNVILTTYFFLLTAPHAKSLSEVVSKFTDDNRIINWTQNMPSMYVVYYDYSAIPLVIFIIMYIEKFERMKKIHLFFCGLLLFLTFDYLPIIAFLILLFRNGIRTFFDYLMLLVSGICFTFFALFYNRKSDLESTFSYYFVNNFSQFFGVLVLIPMILLPHWILGRLVSHWMPNSMASLVQNDPLFRTKLNHGLISLFIVHLMSLFTSNFIGEFGRQSLALQLLITIIAILKKPALNNRGVALQDF